MSLLIAQQQRPLAPEPPPDAGPWTFWTAEEIARAASSPLAPVQRNWPLIWHELDKRMIADQAVQAAAIATTSVETARTFEPIHEYGTRADWERYSGGWRYAGKGFIQLTHDYNYRAASPVVGVDLVANPELAMVPEYAAAIMADFFLTRGVAAAARRHDWREVRRRVQGAYAGLDRLVRIIGDLGLPT